MEIIECTNSPYLVFGKIWKESELKSFVIFAKDGWNRSIFLIDGILKNIQLCQRGKTSRCERRDRGDRRPNDAIYEN